MERVRGRFWLEVCAAAASGVLSVVTLFWRDWIEATGWDPDNGSGVMEVLVVTLLALVSTSNVVASRIEWRHAKARMVATS
jgi:hypothetical protein